MKLTVEQIQDCPKRIDVSRWNLPDYDKVKKAGINSAIVKVNNAGNKPDERFYEHVKGFRNAGIDVKDGYNYTYANTEPKAQRASDSFVNIALPQGIDFMWLDLEDACMRGLGSKILNIINIYRETAEQAGMGFGIYTGASFYNPCLKPYEEELKGISFWWARYPSKADIKLTDSVPDPKNLPRNLELDGWQYSSTLRIDGCKGCLDVSVWFEDNTFSNEQEAIPVEYNPFDEPAGNVDGSVVYGMITEDIVVLIKEVQELLGLEADGIVGKCTKAVWRKIC